MRKEDGEEQKHTTALDKEQRPSEAPIHISYGKSEIIHVFKY